MANPSTATTDALIGIATAAAVKAIAGRTFLDFDDVRQAALLALLEDDAPEPSFMTAYRAALAEISTSLSPLSAPRQVHLGLAKTAKAVREAEAAGMTEAEAMKLHCSGTNDSYGVTAETLACMTSAEELGNYDEPAVDDWDEVANRLSYRQDFAKIAAVVADLDDDDLELARWMITELLRTDAFPSIRATAAELGMTKFKAEKAQKRLVELFKEAVR